jgi:hypothetical protein
VFDNQSKTQFVHLKEAFRQLLEVNRCSEVLAKRKLREDLRSFHWGRDLVRLPFTEARRYTESDGTRTEYYTDSTGKEQSHEVPVQSTITIVLSFTIGRMTVSGESTHQMAPGFTALMNYADGRGSGTLPRTGRRVNKRNEKGQQHVTPGNAMTRESNSRLVELFSFPQNVAPLQKGAI